MNEHVHPIFRKILNDCISGAGATYPASVGRGINSSPSPRTGTRADAELILEAAATACGKSYTPEQAERAVGRLADDLRKAEYHIDTCEAPPLPDWFRDGDWDGMA